MLTLRAINNSDFETFSPIDIQSKEFLDFFAGFYKPEDPHNFAVVFNGNIVLLIGMREMWPGVFDTYTLFSKHWKPVYFKTISRLVKKYIAEMKYDRIQHLVSCNRSWTHKMVKLFGFKNETPDGMDKYIGGEKRYMYAIVS